MSTKKTKDNVTRKLDCNVLEAAKQRINEIIDTFDTVVVNFSGGKDSLTCLHLVKQVYAERGIKSKVKVLFRDEELIPDDVINFVQSHYYSGEYDFAYWCLQLSSPKFILGKVETYVQWDKNRQHIRPVPEFALTDWSRVYTQQTADEFTSRQYKGKVCYLLGIRAQESLLRYRAIINTRNKPFLAKSSHPKVMLGRPLYDWSEKDVFRFFYDHDIKYCNIYDNQLFNQDSLRVATPFLAEASKKLCNLKTLYPIFYDQIVTIFPEAEIQTRYYKDFKHNQAGIIDQYPASWQGMYAYVNQCLTGHDRELAIKRIDETRLCRENALKKGQHIETCGGYPLHYVFKNIINGTYKHTILPTSVLTDKDREYERRACESL